MVGLSQYGFRRKGL